LKRSSRLRSRLAVSELVATVLLIGATLIAGFAVWGWVNGQAGSSERAYGQSVGQTVGMLEEKFSLVNANYSGDRVTLWLYNDGEVSLQPVSVFVYNSSRSVYVLFNATKVVNLDNPSSCDYSATMAYESPSLFNPLTNSQVGNVITVPSGGLQPLTLGFPPCSGLEFNPGVSYTFQILGRYGNTVASYWTR
jgi:hypothetical protein